MKTFMLSFGVALLLCVSAYGQFCDPPGEFVGKTSYPIQSLNSSSNRISMDNLGGISVTWTNYVVDGPRNVYFNFRNENGEWSYEGGSRVNEESRAGFASISLFSDNRAAIAYHNTSMPENYVMLAMNYWRGSALFEFIDVPDELPNGNGCLWPQVAVSANGDIHILMREFRESENDGYLAYTRSEDGGYSWTNLAIVDSVAGSSGCITAASDGKVAIVYPRPADWDDFHGLKNDVCYFLSSNGRDWDFSLPECITDYENDDLDIYCPWGIDAAFDFGGYLNAIWLSGNIDEDGQIIDDVTKLWHFSERTGEIDLISQMIDPDLECDPNWLQIEMPTISVNSTGAVEVIYVGFVDSDVSSEGDCVGDLYMAYEPNYGENWFGPFNITETHSDGCLPGDCLSESQPSTAEIMADSVYLAYILQKFGDDPDTVYYMPVAVPYWVSVDDPGDMPESFDLYGNYPNPFNSSTAIRFEIEKSSRVNLTIYDITGAEVTTLIDGEMEAGLHSVSWNADGFASGVYYHKLETDSGSQIKKMLFLK